MKRFFTSLLLLCICVLSASAQVLFSTDFATEEDFQAWTVVDANEDGSTWKFDSWGDPSKCSILIMVQMLPMTGSYLRQ